MGDGGKGSRPRPFSVPMDVFNENFNKIFGVDDARKQRTNDDRVPDSGDDERPAAEGGTVQPSGKPGA